MNTTTPAKTLKDRRTEKAFYAGWDIARNTPMADTKSFAFSVSVSDAFQTVDISDREWKRLLCVARKGFADCKGTV